MRRGLLLAAAVLPALAGCGTSFTKTVTRTAAAPAVTAPTATTATTPSTPTATATVTGVTTPATPAAHVYFEGAVGRPVQRPASLQLTADGTLSVEAVQWTSWGGAVATGTGHALYHGCTPNCAAAPVHAALVSIRLLSVRVCSGRSYYSGVRLVLTSGGLLDRRFLQRSWSPC